MGYEHLMRDQLDFAPKQAANRGFAPMKHHFQGVQPEFEKSVISGLASQQTFNGTPVRHAGMQFLLGQDDVFSVIRQ